MDLINAVKYHFGVHLWLQKAYLSELEFCLSCFAVLGSLYM